MKRLWLLLALSAVVVAGGAVAAWYLWPRPKFDFDQLGGTVLVYEIAPPRDEREEVFDPDRDMAILAEVLQRRLDPDNRDEVTVRSAGKGRVEIRIARTKDDHVGQLKQVKSLISKAGHLEFRVLANSHDDQPAIPEIREWLNRKDDAELAKDLEDRQLRGLPPPVPRNPETKQPRIYALNLAAGNKSSVSYNWLELSPHERQALNLDDAAEHDPKRNGTWLEAKKERGRATILKPAGGDFGDQRLLQGALFFSRECKDKDLPEEERLKKWVEYFVLARDPEFEAAIPEMHTPALNGAYLTRAHRVKSADGRPAVSITFNNRGGELFGNLTRKNISVRGREGPNQAIEFGEEDKTVRRHLAIILDGQVMSAPTINSEVRTQAQLSGNFTEKEVDDMVQLFRSGCLPARLKAAPVSETEIAPQKKK